MNESTMNPDSIFKIEMQRRIGQISEYTLMDTAKEAVEKYKNGLYNTSSGTEKMKMHQMEMLANLARNMSSRYVPSDSVVAFISKQGKKDRDSKKKNEDKTWAFKPNESQPELCAHLRIIIEKQKEQAKSLLDEVAEEFPQVFPASRSGEKKKKEWLLYVYIRLVRAFCFHFVTWYYTLPVLRRITEE